MSIGFPSMPEYDPATPEDGLANVCFTADGMDLALAGGVSVHVPNTTIARDSIVITPGSDTDVNRVTLTLLASEVDVDDDAPVAEIQFQKIMSVARFEAEAVDEPDA